MATVEARPDARPLVWPAKDANEVITHSIEFEPRLGDDTIASATFSLVTAAGLVIDSSDYSGSIASVTLSAGTEGSKGKILCRIVTGDGDRFDETVSLPIRAR